MFDVDIIFASLYLDSIEGTASSVEIPSSREDSLEPSHIPVSATVSAPPTADMVHCHILYYLRRET